MRRALIFFVLPFLVLAGLMPSASALQQVTLNSLVSSNPANFTPQVLDGEVDAIAQVGQLIVLGGSFTQVQASGGGATLTRNRILAFNKDTGAISTTFAPSMDSDVKSLATGPNNTVYVGGKFNSAGGTTAHKITQLNLSNGSVVSSFKPKTVNAIVRDVQYAGGRLFIGGEFTTIGGVARHRLAELNPTTGALLSLDVPLEGRRWDKGSTQIYHMDVNPDATKLVLAGDFTSVGGQPRNEVAMVDLTTNTVTPWQTSRFDTRCYDVFEFIVRDVEFSPDGSYFVIGTTGGYGPGSPSMCDSVSRWESSATGAGVNPTWIDYSGGDSTYTTAVTGSAIYIGGHERWMNNPSRGDAEGPGAVARQGIAALDPVNGLPLSWNPGRTRGQGVFAMLATTEGLFIGSDTDQVHGEYHAKVAFFPLAGGKDIPQPAAPTLPGTLNSLGDLSHSTSNVLYRVNSGGQAINSLDAGPDWSDDSTTSSSLRNSGNNAAGYSTVPNINSSVPSSTPSDIFSTERWDPGSAGDGNEMQWAFPVTAGTHVSVRLYLANRCTCTSGTGQRKFNVDIDGNHELVNYDIVADAGDQTGEMKSFPVTSDGTVNIDFGHVTENPLINGIEIVNDDVTATGPDENVESRSFNGTTVGGPATISGGGTDFSQATGAFMADGDLYTAWSDGHLYKRTFNGTTFGPAQDIDLNGLTNFASEMRSMTGLFYTNGRIYYTLAGQSSLFMRYFTVENGVVGAGLKELAPFTVSGNLADVDWKQVRGMTFAGGKLYYAERSTGNLYSVNWNAGPSGTDGSPVSGTRTLVSGPGTSDHTNWAQKALFARSGAQDQPPNADARLTGCTNLACDFDGTHSSDPEGGSLTYKWDFGDGDTSTAAQPSHEFASAGQKTVNLSVTDSAGAVDDDQLTFTVSAASTDTVSFVGSTADTQAGSTKAHSAKVPAGVQVGDSMVAYFNDNAPNIAVTAPSGWTQVGTMSTSGMLTRIWSKTATASDVGGTVALSTASATKGQLALTAYDDAAPITTGDVAVAKETSNRTTHTTPGTTVSTAGSWVASMWADKTAATTSWTTPAGQTKRQLLVDTGAGHPTTFVTDTNGTVPTGAWSGVPATANSSSLQATMATVVVRPAG